MSTEGKSQAFLSDSELDSRDVQHHAQSKAVHLLDGVRVGLTVLALLCGLTILGTAGDALAVYNTTSLPGDFHLGLWPTDFDLRPTIALVVGSAIVVLFSIISIVCSKVQQLRSRALVHTPVTFVAPLFGFIGVMVSMIWFYAVNSSTTVDTLQSWSCQWEFVSMNQKPHFGQLCKESKTALYLSVILVPVEAAILSVAAYQAVLEKKVAAAADARKRSSPALS